VKKTDLREARTQVRKKRLSNVYQRIQEALESNCENLTLERIEELRTQFIEEYADLIDSSFDRALRELLGSKRLVELGYIEAEARDSGDIDYEALALKYAGLPPHPLSNLTAGMNRINSLELSVIELNAPEYFEFEKGPYKFIRGRVKDSSGDFPILFWGDQGDRIHIGDKIKIINAYVKKYEDDERIYIKGGPFLVVAKRSLILPIPASKEVDKPE